MIGDNPDLGPIQGLSPEEAAREGGAAQECVDHHIFRDEAGRWHLWGCIRQTAVGRVLYHWRAERITDHHWERTGETIRADRKAGECLMEHDGDEWLQSPFIVREDGRYYMFYGGHGTGLDAEGNPLEEPGRSECQICLMTSPDGESWTRHADEAGRSRLFVGPGQTRDPCLLRLGDGWIMYYAGNLEGDLGQPAFFARTSEDLLHWSEPRVVHRDMNVSGGPWDTECPHVVPRGGRYYLFRTADYGSAETHLFVSEDPFDFGVGDASGQYLGTFPVAAPEIIVTPDGEEYISSNHDLTGGTRLCRLRWERG